MTVNPLAGRVVLLLGAALLVAPACRDASRETIDRETFVETYVQLREAALRTSGGQVTSGERDEVLERLGVSEEDLLRFVEVHGTDVAYMAGVWSEVETRLEPDTVPVTPP
jgi:hypothetical protein